MSGRGASGAMLTAIAASQNKPFHLAEAAFDAGDGGTVYLSDSYRTIVWNGNSYTAFGHFLGYSSLLESRELRLTQAQIQLSAVDQVWISFLINRKYIGRVLTIRKAFLDANEAVIVDPIPVLVGQMDAPLMQEDPTTGQCTIQLQASSYGVDIEAPAGIHTNMGEHQSLFPGDLGLQFAAQTAALAAGRLVYWGRPGVPLQPSLTFQG
jgi:hypothetical protein